MALFIGIDGGGTRTTAAAFDGQGRELARVQGGAGLVRSTHPTAGAAALALAPVAAPTALAVPGGPAAVPVDMPFDGQGADDAPGGTDRA